MPAARVCQIRQIGQNFPMNSPPPVTSQGVWRSGGEFPGDLPGDLELNRETPGNLPGGRPAAGGSLPAPGDLPVSTPGKFPWGSRDIVIARAKTIAGLGPHTPATGTHKHILRNRNNPPTHTTTTPPLESRGRLGWNPGDVQIWEIGHASPGDVSGKAPRLCSYPEIGR